MLPKSKILTDNEIDTIRMGLLTEFDKRAEIKWWDICAAIEKMYGADISGSVEQRLIDITNKTAEQAAKAQLEADDAHYQAEHQKAVGQEVIAERKRIGEWLEMADADMNFQDVIDALKSGQSIDG